jgi:hypothetical protein
MRTFLRGKVTLLFMTFGLLLAIPAIALADQIIGDGDTVTGTQQTVALGTVAPGAQITKTASFTLLCNSAQHIEQAETLSLNFSSADSKVTDTSNNTVAASGGVSVVTTNTANTTNVRFPTVPNTWPTDTNPCASPNPQTLGSTDTADVTITAPSQPGTYSAVAVFNHAQSAEQNSDIAGNQTTITYTLTVPSNTPPVANNDTYNATEDTQLTVAAPGVLDNDTDDQNNDLTAVLVSGPSNAAATNGFTLNADGSFSYTPKANFFGSDTFTYKANDGTVDSNSAATVTINVASVDDPPTAVNDSATVQEDAPATAINVLANDTDADGGPKTISSASDPAKGTVALTGGTSGEHTGLTYQPDPNYCNDPPATNLDTFTYTLNGGSQGTVSVKVTCVNDAPTTPGAITSDESLNNDGTFKLNWDDSTDVDSANITYTLEHRDFAATSDWSLVASDLTASEYTFVGTNPELEGLWDYRVKAVDDYSPPASSDFREDLDLVTVDKTNPNAPTLNFATTGQSFKATVDGVDWYKDLAKINVSANGDPNNARDNSPGSGVDATSFPASFDVTTNGESTTSKTVKDNATNESAASDELTVHVDAADPTFDNCQSGTFLVNSGSGTPTTQSVSINASDGESGIDSANSQLTKSVDTSSTGTKTVTFTAKDKVGHSVTKNCDYTVNTHTFTGFSSPVDNPNYLNSMKAGQAVPLKWQLKDASGNPVTNLQSVTVTTTSRDCTSGVAGTDVVEEYATGSSSLQNLGGGYYQFNWASPKSYANSCKTLTLNGVGVQQQAYFKFLK